MYGLHVAVPLAGVFVEEVFKAFDARMITKAVEITGASVLSKVDADPVFAAVVRWGSVEDV